MKDLDFDELDRAVNSLLSSNAAKPYQTEPQERVVELGSDPTPAETPVASTPTAPLTTTTSVASPVSTTLPTPTSVPVVPQPQPPLAGRRSAGQFMDVVHPSSDMRRTPSLTPVLDGQRARPDLTPVSRLTAPTPTAPPTVVLPNPTETIEDNLTSDSQESPFIPGAQVEKRPLGAFSDQQTTPLAEQPKATTAEIKPTPVKTEESDESQEKLPEELQDELLKIESGEVDGEGEGSLDEMETPNTPEIAPTEATTSLAQPSVPVATSIVQQYTEHPSTGEQDNGAIYDTEDYHKALVQPKKKAGWLWIVWIVLLIILGAAGGAAFFVFVLPTL